MMPAEYVAWKDEAGADHTGELLTVSESGNAFVRVETTRTYKGQKFVKKIIITVKADKLGKVSLP